MAYSETRLLEYRTYEIGVLRKYFGPGLRVLEIGGGNGWQARQIADWGCDTASIDVGANAWQQQYFPVASFDGVNIPFGDRAFDVVYSSNVLEHVERLPELLAEIKRVLRPGGRAINLMPTPAWRIWTSLSYYLLILDKLSARQPPPEAQTDQRDNSSERRSGLQRLVAPPHGLMPTALHEIFTFSRAHWTHSLSEAGLPPHEDFPIGLFYTGHMISALSIQARQRLARIAGSACRAYISPG